MASTEASSVLWKWSFKSKQGLKHCPLIQAASAKSFAWFYILPWTSLQTQYDANPGDLSATNIVEGGKSGCLTRPVKTSFTFFAFRKVWHTERGRTAAECPWRGLDRTWADCARLAGCLSLQPQIYAVKLFECFVCARPRWTPLWGKV